ncbi:MAG: membrane protein insertase YidC [Candidatus Buchananbacteria bacterium]|nr:membrane protein insertase YidC [Candidatus Buchananbacteria bacterium]
MIELFNTILFQPLFNLLVFFYNLVPGNDLGVAIILLTVLIKVVLYPLSLQSIRSQKALQELQPKMDAIKKQYKDNKEAQAKALMDLYKQEKINPLSSCLPLLVQLPFLIAVFHVFSRGLSSESLDLLYPFIQNPGHLNPISLGFFDLSKPNIILAVLTGLAQFFQSKMLVSTKQPKVPGAKDEDMMAAMNKQMLYFMPLMTVVIGASLPAGLLVYWFVTTVLTVLQQQLIFGRKKIKPAETTNNDENLK